MRLNFVELAQCISHFHDDPDESTSECSGRNSPNLLVDAVSVMPFEYILAWSTSGDSQTLTPATKPNPSFSSQSSS